MQTVGCEACWSSDAPAAFKIVCKVPIAERLIDESHYIVLIRQCLHCSQRYLQMTTETVDWADGEDPIYRTIVPIDQGEYGRLTTAVALGTGVIESVAVGRQSLKYDFPKGQESPTVYWSAVCGCPGRDSRLNARLGNWLGWCLLE